MAINRYTVLPEQRIINTHVAQDLGLANAALASKQKGYDEAELFDQSIQDSLGKFATRDVDVARKNQLVKDYQQKALAIVDQYNGDYSQAMPALKKLANAASQNEFWQRATSALSRDKDMLAAEKRIMEKGGSVLGFNRSAHEKAVWNEDGSYNDVDYDVQERLNRPDAMRKYYDHMKGDKSSGGLTSSGVAGLLKTGSLEGIGDKKIRDVMEQGIASYIQGTPEGMQHFKEYTQLRGMDAKQAYGKIAQEMLGVGEQYKYQQSDTSYVGDPSYDKEAGKIKEEMLIEQTSPAVDYEPENGLKPTMFDKVPRYQRQWVDKPSSPAGGYFITKKGTAKFADLKPEQRASAAKFLQERFPKIAEKMRKGTLTKEEQEEFYPRVGKAIKALRNLKIGASVTSISSSDDYGYGKGEEGLTLATFGSTSLKKANAGKFIGTKVRMPDGTVLSGEDFYKKVSEDAEDDDQIRITGRFSPVNIFALQHQDPAFSDAKQVVIKGQQYVIAGLNEKRKYTQDGQSVYRDLSAERRKIGGVVTSAMGNLGSPVKVPGGSGVTITMRSDGKFVLAQKQGDKINRVVTENPAATLADIYNITLE